MLQDIPGLRTYPEWPSAKANLHIGLQSHPYHLSHRQLPFLFTKGPKDLGFLNKSLSQIITPASDGRRNTNSLLHTWLPLVLHTWLSWALHVTLTSVSVPGLQNPWFMLLRFFLLFEQDQEGAELWLQPLHILQHLLPQACPGPAPAWPSLPPALEASLRSGMAGCFLSICCLIPRGRWSSHLCYLCLFFSTRNTVWSSENTWKNHDE